MRELMIGAVVCLWIAGIYILIEDRPILSAVFVVFLIFALAAFLIYRYPTPFG